MNTQADSIRVHRINTGRITLNVREAGEGPIAIFLHGITSNAAVWDPILLDLKSELRAIAVDQRGHGQSEKPNLGYSAVDYSEDIIALIETLNAGPAIIVGNSLGARNGVVIACLRPDLVTAVIAIDFTPYIEPEVFAALEARVTAGDRTFRSREEIEEYLQNRYPKMPPEAIHTRAMSAYAKIGNAYGPLAFPKAMELTAASLREDFERPFKEVSRPVLVVRGAESKFVSEAAFEQTRRLRPDLPTLQVENADHYVNEEAPRVISNAIREFAIGYNGRNS